MDAAGATVFPSCSAQLRNRAGEGRDPWDGGTELRKELLCSHLNRDRCWRRREVGQTKDRETGETKREPLVYSMRTCGCSLKYGMTELAPPLPTQTFNLIRDVI